MKRSLKFYVMELKAIAKACMAQATENQKEGMGFDECFSEESEWWEYRLEQLDEAYDFDGDDDEWLETGTVNGKCFCDWVDGLWEDVSDHIHKLYGLACEKRLVAPTDAEEAPVDLISLHEAEGEEAVKAYLETLDVPELKALAKANDMYDSRITTWKTTARWIDYLVSKTHIRAYAGKGFLAAI